MYTLEAIKEFVEKLPNWREIYNEDDEVIGYAEEIEEDVCDFYDRTGDYIGTFTSEAKISEIFDECEDEDEDGFAGFIFDEE